jgi:hypothetical protein
MTFTAREFTPATGVAYTSDVEAVDYRDGMLVVAVACGLDADRTVRGLRVTFTRPAGFRLLDELDLHRYWMTVDWPRGSHVLEVTGGGWAKEEDALQGFDTIRREWLVVTGNACVSVFCAEQPLVAETSWMCAG